MAMVGLWYSYPIKLKTSLVAAYTKTVDSSAYDTKTRLGAGLHNPDQRKLFTTQQRVYRIAPSILLQQVMSPVLELKRGRKHAILRNLTMISVHNSLAGCVIVYSRLAKIVNEVCGGLEESRSDCGSSGAVGAVLGIIEDLLRQKLSLNLMLTIILCPNPTEASEIRTRLCVKFCNRATRISLAPRFNQSSRGAGSSSGRDVSIERSVVTTPTMPPLCPGGVPSLFDWDGLLCGGSQGIKSI